MSSNAKKPMYSKKTSTNINPISQRQSKYQDKICPPARRYPNNPLVKLHRGNYYGDVDGIYIYVKSYGNYGHINFYKNFKIKVSERIPRGITNLLRNVQNDLGNDADKYYLIGVGYAIDTFGVGGDSQIYGFTETPKSRENSDETFFRGLAEELSFEPKNQNVLPRIIGNGTYDMCTKGRTNTRKKKYNVSYILHNEIVPCTHDPWQSTAKDDRKAPKCLGFVLTDRPREFFMEMKTASKISSAESLAYYSAIPLNQVINVLSGIEN